MTMKCPVCGAKYDDAGLENANCGECLMNDVKIVRLVPDIAAKTDFKLPWSVGRNEDGGLVFDSELIPVCDTTDEAGDVDVETARAELIVVAVNSHEGLLAALRKIAEYMGELCGAARQCAR